MLVNTIFPVLPPRCTEGSGRIPRTTFPLNRGSFFASILVEMDPQVLGGFLINEQEDENIIGASEFSSLSAWGLIPMRAHALSAMLLET